MAALAPGDADRILHDVVLPVVFPLADADSSPSLTLLHTPRGHGAGRATAGLVSAHPSYAVLSAADLRSFHPSAGGRAEADPMTAHGEVDAVVAEWFRACVAYAREHRRSLLIEGAFMTPKVAAGTAQGFAAAGFSTSVAVVAVSRAEALLAVVSEHLRSTRDRRTQPLPAREAIEHDWESTSTLVAEVASRPGVDRIVVFGRDGTVEVDAASSGEAGVPASIVEALRAAQQRPLTSLQAAQWLSELRRITDFVDSHREPEPEVVEALVELHVVAIRDVVRRLPVPPGSEVISREEGRLAAELVRLRRAAADAAPSMPAGPMITGPTRGPEGPSR